MIESLARPSPVIRLGLQVLLLGLLFAARSVNVLRTIEWSLCVVCVLCLLIFAYFSWVFRDPFMTHPSEGATALLRFAHRIWLVLVIITGVLILSAFVYRIRLVRLRGRCAARIKIMKYEVETLGSASSGFSLIS
jgi:hypothetical protein